MALLILGVLVIAVGSLLVIGFLVMTENLFSESIFAIPDEPDEVTWRQCTDEERSTFSSSIPIG
jgi:hypothetical protein